MADLTSYAEPQNPALPDSDFALDLEHAALVITDPQIDFLSPEGVAWPVFGESIRDNDVVAHIGELLDSAKLAGMCVAVSPHYFYPTDRQWRFGDPLEKFMSAVGMFGRQGAYTTDGFAGSGADFLPTYRHHIHDGQTVIASPHKIVGPESNDLVLQLRKRGVSQVILAGMAANLCVEGHLRELIEQGFEVAVVKDATAGPRLPEGDGYLAALVNFRFLASAVWTTAEAVAALKHVVPERIKPGLGHSQLKRNQRIRRPEAMASNQDLSQHRFSLNNGSGDIPALGFGTSLSDNTKTRDAVKTAVQVGFRHLDAAERYRNEAEVGAALKELFAEGTVRREDLFVTTKLWNNNHRPERVKPALQASLNRLGLDAVDLYLVHTPFAFKPGDDQDPRDIHGAIAYDEGVTLEETWAAMEALVDEGLTRAIGLSDIDIERTRRVVDTARIKPAVVEVESHPYHPQWELHGLRETDGIILLAFASLGHALEPRLLDDPLVVSIARRVGKTPAQVLLAWGIQRGTAVLTGSVTPSRIRENFDVTALPESAIQEINERLETRYRFNSVVDGGEPGFAEVPQGS